MKQVLDWFGESPLKMVFGFFIFGIAVYYSYRLLMILFGTLWALVQLLFWPAVVLGVPYLAYVLLTRKPPKNDIDTRV